MYSDGGDIRCRFNAYIITTERNINLHEFTTKHPLLFHPLFPFYLKFYLKSDVQQLSCKMSFQTLILMPSKSHFILLLRSMNMFQGKHQEEPSAFLRAGCLTLDLTNLEYSVDSLTSCFLKGEQIFLLSSLFSFCRLPVQSAVAFSVLLCLSVLWPGHGQSFRRSLNSISSIFNHLLFR